VRVAEKGKYVAEFTLDLGPYQRNGKFKESQEVECVGP